MLKSRLPLTLVRLVALAVLPFVGGVPLAQAASLCLSNTTQINPVLPEADMTGLVYFRNKFVAVASNGVAMYSANGTNWTQEALTGGPGLQSLAANSTEIIAVGNSTTFVSGDGVNWTPGVTVSNNTLNGITWTGSQWLAVGDNGELDTSPDGNTWTNHPSGAADVNLLKVTFTGFTYVAVGTNGTIATSSDGVNWITHSSGAVGAETALTGVAYDPNPGNQILVASGDSGQIFTSVDQGNTWSVDAGAPPVAAWENVRWFQTPGLFVVTGYGDSIMTSPDGKNWTVATSNTAPALTYAPYYLADVAETPSGGQAVSVGQNTLIFNTTNYSTWNQLYMGVYANLNAIDTDGLLGIVEVGGPTPHLDDPKELLAPVVFSVDAAHFGISEMEPVNLYNTASEINFNPQAVAYSPTLATFAAVGADNSVQISTDGGLDWTVTLTYTAKGYEEVSFNDIKWVGAEFIAAGNQPPNDGKAVSLGNLQFSPNGVIWAATGHGVTSEDMRGLATNGNGRVVAVGVAGEVTVTSDAQDGQSANWVGIELNGLPTMNKVAYGNGLWVAVGDSGASFTAPDVTNPDGTLTWTANGMDGATENLNSVRFINGIFYAFGAAGDIFMSLDGFAWLPCVGPDATGMIDGVGSPLGVNMLGVADGTFLGTPPSSVPAVKITKQPSDTAAVSGKSFNLSALGISEDTTTGVFYPVFYQWLFNGVDLVNGGNVINANEATLTINPANGSSAGNYTVLVSNGLRSVLSRKAKVTLNFAPTITVQPLSQHVLQASSMSLTVSATGSPTLKYQWYWKGKPLLQSAVIQGVKSKTLRILVTQPKRSGAYECVVSNPYGKATSNIATVKMG